MSSVLIASVVLLWVVLGLLCVLVVSLVRQLGEMNLRLRTEAERDEGV